MVEGATTKVQKKKAQKVLAVLFLVVVSVVFMFWSTPSVQATASGAHLLLPMARVDTVLYDESDYGNDGTAHGTTDVQGYYGRALEFDGVDDYVDIDGSYDSLLAGWSTFTVMCWVYPVQFETADRIWSKASDEDTWGYIYNTTGTVGFRCGFAGDGKDVLGNTSLTLNAWAHTAMVLDGVGLKIYFNATLDSPANSDTGTIEDSALDFTLGERTGVSTEWFNGTMDEVRVFNRALSQSEIQSEMDNSLMAYTLYGAYNEEGTRDGAINVTLYRQTQSAYSFELNGSQSIQSEMIPVAFHFDLGNNQSRVYYLNDEAESIYVFNPSEPYYTYYVTLVDYVGLTNAYLESIIVANGTDYVVERWQADVLNDIPFTLSWGVVYRFKVVSDEGSYIFGDYVAGPDTTITLTITVNAFPPSSIHIGNITLSALRLSGMSIGVNYSDSESLTDWVSISITVRGASTPAYTTNSTGSTHQVTWSDALPSEDYYAYVECSHQEEGTLRWRFSCPAPITETNPWNLDVLGDFPISSDQIVGLAMVLCVFAVFSQGTSNIGIIATLLSASALVLMGFLDISWTWMTLVWCIGMIVIFTQRKRGGYR